MIEKLKIHRGRDDQSEERALIVAASEGNQKAFHSLYEMHRDRVYRVLYHLCEDLTLAEDLLHDVFLKVYKALPRFRFESAFSTWIYRIALNEARYHKRQRKHSIPLAKIMGRRADRDGSPDPLDAQVLRQRQAIVRRAVLELPPKLRTVTVLKYVEGLSYDEIAQILDCSPGTVASRLSRALRTMDRLLRPLEKLL